MESKIKSGNSNSVIRIAFLKITFKITKLTIQLPILFFNVTEKAGNV